MFLNSNLLSSSGSGLRIISKDKFGRSFKTNKQTIYDLLKEIKLKIAEGQEVETAIKILILFIEFCCCQSNSSNISLLLLKIQLQFCIGQRQWAELQLEHFLLKINLFQMIKVIFIVQESKCRALKLKFSQHLLTISSSQSTRLQVLKHLRRISMLPKSQNQTRPDKTVHELLSMFNLLDPKEYISVLTRDFLAEANYFQTQLNSQRQAN